ncbi:unnamed protein product [Rhodiola kirilowii]
MSQYRNRDEHVLQLAYQSFGMIFGSLSTSPLYVYESMFSGRMHHYQTEDVAFGAFSLVFWSLTIITLLKYAIFMLDAHDHGEGGTFALYSLLCRHAKSNLLPNYQAVDEELSRYYNPCHSSTIAPSPLKIYIDKNQKFRTVLLVVVLCGACMVMCAGILNPSISVLSSLDGLQFRVEQLSHRTVVGFACAVLVGQFALQHRGTYQVAFVFSPVVLVWLLFIAGIGIYNVIQWNPRIYLAFSPHYIYLYLQQTGKDGWLSLGNVFLAVTGTEAMFANLGNFTPASLRVAFICVVYPCLIIQYMGQAAFISKNFYAVPSSFYASIPELMFWPVFVTGSLAAIVGSQAIISGTFSIVKQCQALGCLPRVKVVRKLRWIHGHVYVPEINWLLMILSLAVTFGFRNTTLIGNAYGLVSIIVTFVNTWLISLVIIFVWNQSWYLALLFLLFFGSFEFVYLSSSLMQLPKGGWVPVVVSMLIFSIMYIWHYCGKLRYMNNLQNKVSMKWIISLGPSLGIVRIPGIAIIFSELVNGIPPMFSHFISNLPAFYHIAVFVCVKNVPVPYVSDRERYLIGRIGPKTYRMYRCIVRYGYKDVPAPDEDFEDNIVASVVEFIQLEATGRGTTNLSIDKRLAVVRRSESYGKRLMSISADSEVTGLPFPTNSTKSARLQKLRASYEQESSPLLRQRHSLRFRLIDSGYMDPEARDELLELVNAKHAGVAYIIGRSRIKAKRHSSFLHKFVINVVYSFLRKNCRSPSVALNIPQICLIEVGMNHYL